MQAPILKVRNLTTKLKLAENLPEVAVVDNISFDLHRGKTLAIVGESGCGKSMTALSLMRILPSPPALPSTGDVIYKDTNLLTVSEKKMRSIRGAEIAMIFQDPTTALNPVYTIGNQLIEVAELHLGLYGQEAFEKAASVLNEVGISSPIERMQNYPHELSGGMRQRVMIAMALMCEPDILIADEPTTALDVTIQAQILDPIRSLQKTKDMAVLLITHDMGIVAEMADEVIVMYAAEEIERAKATKLFNDMAHPYTKELFASRAAMHAPKSLLHTIKGSVPSPQDFPNGCRFHPRCPYAMDICKIKSPGMFKIKDDEEHIAKCFLYDSNV